MLLSVLHTISGCVIVLSLVGKVIIHYLLNRSRGAAAGLGSIVAMPLQYLLPYKHDVNSKYQPLKYCCNFLLLLAVVALIVNIIFGVLIYLN